MDRHPQLRVVGWNWFKRSGQTGRHRKSRTSIRERASMGFELLEARQMLAVTPLTLADSSFAGLSAFGDSSTPTMSADGQLICFQSAAENLVLNDNNGESDVFVFDRAANSVRLVSVALDGTAAGRSSQYSAPVISPDGRYIAFESSSAKPLA